MPVAEGTAGGAPGDLSDGKRSRGGCDQRIRIRSGGLYYEAFFHADPAS